MSTYSNNFRSANRDPKPISRPLPRHHLFSPLQSRHNSDPAKSGLNILDLIEVWREDVLRASQRLNEQVHWLSPLKLSEPVSQQQPHSPFAQSWTEPGLGRDKSWPWMDETPIFSSSPAFDVSSQSTARARQSLNAFDPIESQGWPSFPSWDLSAAAARDVSLVNEAHAGIYKGKLTPQSLHSCTIASVTSQGQYHTQTHIPYRVGQRFSFPTRSTSVVPHQGSTSFGSVRTTFDTFTSPGPMLQVPIGSGLATTPVPVSDLRNLPPASLDYSSNTPSCTTPSEWQHGPAVQPLNSFFPNSSSVVPPTTAPRGVVYDKKGAPAQPAPFNRKSELYKTEMCRNWEEKGYCFYKE
ncbi:hypothetical protein EX895_004443 [Sporisorium graminicola]|uniref:C3H1-type domain-containing protein n=1 Tax=Sporisorium graminicola TaxID=280036 RepID=A0A4U7KUZ2_9BASI|nr:hypothetical protein EX895_004443 [Sporisorium graminicola]TKY86802.1 hypothetical protein EX895_004443 [Sporisorium graminicola]